MTNEKILEKVLEKARDNGYKDEFNILQRLDNSQSLYQIHDGWILNDECQTEFALDIKTIIFDHDFAKAFWGEETEAYWEEWRDGKTGMSEGNYGYQTNWQHHLQQMVLWKNPLHYLATFLKSECCDAEIKYTENSGVYICPGHFCTKCNKLL